MSEAMTAVVAVERKCKFEELFDAGFIELIRLVPRNPHVRALILKLAGKMPGPECETLEQIREWVETHCEKRARPLVNQTSRRVAEDGIAINVDFSETEYGRADYSVPRSGSEEFHVDADDLIEMVQGAIESGGGMDEVVELIAGKIDDDAWSQCEPDMDNYGDHNYSEHESNDSGDSSTDYSKTDIRNAVLAFVQQRHPELAAEL